LGADSLRGLEDFGLFSGEPDFDGNTSTELVTRIGDGGEEDGVSMPWFSSMVEGSALGRVTRRSGTSSKGDHKVEWEVYEWVEEPEESVAAVGKRKRARGEGADVEMTGDGA
jgi:hypothetical protein